MWWTRSRRSWAIGFLSAPTPSSSWAARSGTTRSLAPAPSWRRMRSFPRIPWSLESRPASCARLRPKRANGAIRGRRRPRWRPAKPRVFGFMLLSIVTPSYNEAENLPRLYRRLCELNWAALGLEWEWVVVDDHSRDATQQVLGALVAGDPRVRWLRFSRNFGSHAGCTAGLEHSRGDAAIVMAADLQDPPETIPALVEKWRGGADVVWAVRRVS